MTMINKVGYYIGKMRTFLGQIKDYSKEFDINNMERDFRRENGQGNTQPQNPDNQAKQINQQGDIQSKQINQQGSSQHENRTSKEGGQQGNANRPVNKAGSLELVVTKLALLEIVESNYNLNMSKAVVPFLFDNKQEVIDKTLNILKKDPLFSFERRTFYGRKRTDSIEMNPNSNYFNTVFDPERLKGISDEFFKVPKIRFEKSLKLFAELTGIDNLDINLIFSKEKSSLFSEFKKIRKEYIQSCYPPQGFISPSYSCNLNCSYCFSKDLHKKFSEDMKVEDFVLYIKKLKEKFNAKEIGFFGGEPTYFEKLPEFISELEKEELNFNFASNGIADPDRWREIVSRRSLLMVTLHIEKDDFYKDQETIETIITNIKTLNQFGRPLVFRFNLTDYSEMDWSFLNKYIDLVPDFKFSFALPFPSGISDNDYVQIDEIKHYGSTILQMIKHIREYCGNKMFTIVLAKPIPLCVFTDEEYQEILKYVRYKNVCEVDQNDSANNLMINPDGSYQPCAGLNSDKYLYKNFDKIESLPSAYHMNIDRLINKPIIKDCKKCYLFSIGVCQGVCYAYSK